MHRIAILVLADTQAHGNMARMANALEAVKEFKEGGDDVRLILDGAAIKWAKELADSGHTLAPLYAAVRDKLAGACTYCAGAFGVKAALEEAGVPLLGEYDGPSLRRWWRRDTR
jgi:hypothetical protein